MPRILPSTFASGSIALLVALASLTLWLAGESRADSETRPNAAAGDVPPAVAALRTSLAGNVAYAEQWLARDDFASLRQTAGDLAVLVDALDRQSDDAAWRGEVAAAAKHVAALERAAAKKDRAAGAEAAKSLDAWTKALRWRGGTAHSASEPPKASGRAMMHFVDVALADAKTSAAVGDWGVAKDHARVLSLASTLLSNERAEDADWTKHARGMAEDALRAANVAEPNPRAFREALADAARRCTDCHADFR